MEAFLNPHCSFDNGLRYVCRDCAQWYNIAAYPPIEYIDEHDWKSPFLFLYNHREPITQEQFQNIEQVNLIDEIAPFTVKREYLESMSNSELKNLVKGKYRLEKHFLEVRYNDLPLVTKYMFIRGFHESDEKLLVGKIGKKMADKWFSSNEFLAIKNECQRKLDSI